MIYDSVAVLKSWPRAAGGMGWPSAERYWDVLTHQEVVPGRVVVALAWAEALDKNLRRAIRGPTGIPVRSGAG